MWRTSLAIEFQTILRNVCDFFQLIRLIAFNQRQYKICFAFIKSQTRILSIKYFTGNSNEIETGIKLILIQSSNNNKAAKNKYLFDCLLRWQSKDIVHRK